MKEKRKYVRHKRQTLKMTKAYVYKNHVVVMEYIREIKKIKYTIDDETKVYLSKRDVKKAIDEREKIKTSPSIIRKIRNIVNGKE